jgi:hypothetical protein
MTISQEFAEMRFAEDFTDAIERLRLSNAFTYPEMVEIAERHTKAFALLAAMRHQSCPNPSPYFSTPPFF